MLSITAGLAFIPWFGRRLGLPSKLNYLVAAGSSICGVTAISALAPAIKANEQETAFAVANVVAFGTLNMLLLPYVAHALLPTSQQAGMFLGLAVHDTAQVVGSALTYSQLFNDDLAMQTAVVTKLTRNVFLAAAIPGLAFMHAREQARTQANVTLPSLAQAMPVFVVGFLGMAALRTAGDMTVVQQGWLAAEQWQQAIRVVGNEIGGHYCLGTAMAAVGLSTQLSSLRGVGPKPFVLGLAGATVVGTTGFMAAMATPAVAAWLAG